MTSHARLEARGVAFLATRMSVLGDDPCGGSEVVMWEDAAILKDAGIPVRVYGRAAREGAPVRVLPLHTSAPLVTSIEYGGQFLSKERDALIIAYNEPVLAGWAPERTIVRFDWSTALPRYWNWPLWLSRFQRARYLFPSESERQLFLRQHGQIPARGTTVVPNAVDLQLFRPVNNIASNQPAKQLRVGFAGQWVPSKGIDDLLDAWRSVKSMLPDVELHLAGGARLWKGTAESAGAAECADRIRQMELDNLLQTVGALPHKRMRDFWNSLSVAVVPSHSESFGLVALEAMACGVPVVAAAVGGLKEIVQDGESGLLVPPGDAASLARGLTTLLTDEPLRRRLATGARRRAEKFSIERRSHELLQLLADRMEKAA
ncbi:MAG: glycosyltransferase family 4 protein [Acidobacteriia bacterium]|nr:glycosyltransferase family 4 protein [Terriglobia bacterium]